MPKISDKPLHRVSIRIWEEDWEKLQRMFGRNFLNGTRGATEAIREMVHTMLVQHEAAVQKIIDNQPKEGPTP